MIQLTQPAFADVYYMLGAKNWDCSGSLLCCSVLRGSHRQCTSKVSWRKKSWGAILGGTQMKIKVWVDSEKLETVFYQKEETASTKPTDLSKERRPAWLECRETIITPFIWCTGRFSSSNIPASPAQPFTPSYISTHPQHSEQGTGNRNPSEQGSFMEQPNSGQLLGKCPS